MIKSSERGTISRRSFIRKIAISSIAVAVPVMAGAKKSDKSSPNIVILFIDDLGYGDVGCFGCKDIPTPHIDSIADDGVKCTNSYITNPPCSPSRCSIMTGMYAQKFGKSGMARGLPIPEDHPTMAEFMKNAGCVTGQIGKWDIGSQMQGPLDRGFMEVVRIPPTAGDKYFYRKKDGSKGFINELDGENMVEFVERNREKPFFLYYSPFAVHSKSNKTPERYQARTKAKGKRRQLAGNIVSVDDAIGRLLQKLKEHELYNNTLIFFTGDNGPNLREGGSAAPYRGGKGKGTQYEGWVRTPAIVSWPGGGVRSGKTFGGLMATFDFYATMAAAVGKPLPDLCDGKNLLPYLRGEKEGDLHEELYWHNADKTDAPRRNLYAMRWKNWRLVKHSKGWKLFDLVKDPQETRDLTGKNPKVVQRMRTRYEAWTAKLPPPIPSSSVSGGGRMPRGYGWATDVKNEDWSKKKGKKSKK